MTHANAPLNVDGRRWLVGLDVKKVGRIPDGGGRRVHGRDSDKPWRQP